MDSESAASGPTGARLYQALERIAALFRTQLREAAAHHGLPVVQLEALLYLARANRYSDSPGALAEYLGVTRGTTSQTIMALERLGFVVKTADAVDGRLVHCSVTESGLAVAAAAHPGALMGLSADQWAEADAAALQLLRVLQVARGARTFGLCQTCRHHQSGPVRRCGLTGEVLTEVDAQRLCREHQP